MEAVTSSDRGRSQYGRSDHDHDDDDHEGGSSDRCSER